MNLNKNFSLWSSKDYFVATILCFILGVIPLVVRFFEVPVNSDELLLIRASTNTNDIFSYAKSILIIISTSVLLLYFISDAITSDDYFDFKSLFYNPVVIASSVFIVMTLLTFIFSDFKQTNIHGFSERYESIFILFAYFIIFFSVFHFVSNLFKLKVILSAILFSAFIITFIGITQLVGDDILLSSFGTRYILGIVSGLNASGVFSAIYGTLFNPNAVGAYASMLLPLTLIIGLALKENLILKSLLLLCSVCMLVLLIGSGSVGGFFSISLTAILAVFLFAFMKRRFLHALVISLAIISIVFFVPPVKSQFDNVISKFTSYHNNVNSFIFNDIRRNGDRIEIFHRNGMFSLSFDSSEQDVLFFDNDNNRIFLTEDSTLHVPNLGSVSFVHSQNDFYLSYSNNIFAFSIQDGSLHTIGRFGDIIDLDTPFPSFGFSGHELFASSRGYIWSRSLPLIKDFIFLGAGADSFALVFPQNDIVGKLNFFGDSFIIIDKPHNFFLQTAINTGFISLLALLFIFTYYLFTTFKSFFSRSIFVVGDNDNFLLYLRFACFLSVFAYLVSSLSTDSSVSVSPIFWAVLGLGFAANKLSNN